MKRVGIAAILLSLLGVPTTATAQTDNLQNLKGRVKENATLLVFDDLQHERRIRFKDVTTDALLGEEGRVRDRSVVNIPSAQIRRIEELRSDPIGRGLGIGLAVGGGLALLGAVGCAETYGYDGEECTMAALLIYAIPGVAIGSLVDYAIKERVVIYQSPSGGGVARTVSLRLSPVLVRRGGGAGLSIRF